MPSVTIGLNFAPIPDPTPTNSKSGGEKYSLPPNLTSAVIILPSEAITFISASLPFFNVTPGFFSKFKISDP